MFIVHSGSNRSAFYLHGICNYGGGSRLRVCRTVLFDVTEMRFCSCSMYGLSDILMCNKRLQKNKYYSSIIYYRPKRSFGQGYVFTGVCDSVHRGGGACSKFSGGGWSGTPPSWHAPPPGSPPLAGTTPPRQAGTPPPGYGQCSAGTHPTGMHSCCQIGVRF